MTRMHRAPFDALRTPALRLSKVRAPSSRAFTLIEVMVVVAIMSIVMGMTVIALNTASVETTMSMTEGFLQNNSNEFALRLMTELRNASRATVVVSLKGDSITFQVPVDVNSDDSVDMEGGKAVFGATFGQIHTKGAFIVYQFRANQVGGADEVLNEAELGIDVNGDGDELDSFKRGLFTRTAPDGNNPPLPRARSDRWFLYGDGDGSGTEDPFFEKVGGTITIRLLAGIVMVRQKTPIRAVVTTSVRPNNP